MKSFIAIAFALFIIVGCQTKPSKEKLQQLLALTAATPQNEFCINSQKKPNTSTSTAIENILSDMGYDCCSLYYKSRGEIEDSVLVLNRIMSFEVKTLYYDFSKRDRELKTWNYPNASDKRLKLEDK